MLTICTISKSFDKELLKTLECLFKQNSTKYKLIVIVSRNNKKNKNYRKIIEYIKFFTNKKILIQHLIGKDNSIYDAMNIGLNKTKTSHLLYLNAGDKLSSNFCIELIGEKILQVPKASHAFSVYNVYKKNIWIRNSNKNFRNFLSSPNYTPPHQGFVAFIGKEKFPFDTKVGFNADSKWINIYTKKKCIYHKEVISIFKLGGISNSYEFISVIKKLKNPKIKLMIKIKIILKFLFFKQTNKTFAYTILHFLKGFKKIS